jgi:hypothetical protein
MRWVRSSVAVVAVLILLCAVLFLEQIAPVVSSYKSSSSGRHDEPDNNNNNNNRATVIALLLNQTEDLIKELAMLNAQHQKDLESARAEKTFLVNQCHQLISEHKDELEAALSNMSGMLESTKNRAAVVAEQSAPTPKVRNVTVGTMCRCDSGKLPEASHKSPNVTETHIVQDGSLATGAAPKHFFMRQSKCDCKKRQGERSNDVYLRDIERFYTCRNDALEGSTMTWDTMPDLGAEERLPLFLGVLTYSSPQSLDAALENWTHAGLHELLSGAHVQLNARTAQDDQVIYKHNSTFAFTVTGSPEENIHPGLAMARFCRAAELSPHGHPNGENLLLFLEKDWQLNDYGRDQLVARILSANTLAQRGVPYIRLGSRVSDPVASWQCDAEGVKWECLTAHQQRFTNLPSIIKCDWFLRYLEPFAIIQDPIMTSCTAKLSKINYCDWEQLAQDGRLEWTNSQWVVANTQIDCGRQGNETCNMFDHVEVDG